MFSLWSSVHSPVTEDSMTVCTGVVGRDDTTFNRCLYTSRHSEKYKRCILWNEIVNIFQTICWFYTLNYTYTWNCKQYWLCGSFLLWHKTLHVHHLNCMNNTCTIPYCIISLIAIKDQFYLQWTRQFRVSKEINVGCLFKTKVWRNRTVYTV